MENGRKLAGRIASALKHYDKLLEEMQDDAIREMKAEARRLSP